MQQTDRSRREASLSRSPRRATPGTAIDEPLAMLRGGITSYYEQDGLGSSTSLSNSAGALANTYTYDSYGKLIAFTGTLANPFQFTGREFDSETGAYYYRSRYYDTGTGRFMTEDPLRFQGGWNFYPYVLNEPTNAVDPYGLKTQVLIVYDSYLGVTVGGHSAVYIDNGNDPILYDPAGSYSSSKRCGSGNACSDRDADVTKFKKFHEAAGSTVKVLTFDTTPAQEAQIAERIQNHGGAGAFQCTTSVIDVLSGIGPFKNLKSTMWPGKLADQLVGLSDGQ